MSNNQAENSISDKYNGLDKADKKKTSSWLLQVTLPALDFGKQGSMEDQTLYISLLGTYVPPDLTGFEELDLKIEKFLLGLENSLRFPIINKQTVMNYSRTSSIFAAESYPQLPVEGPAIESITLLCVAVAWLDDVVEVTLGNIPNAQKWKVGNNILKVLRSVMKGVYRTTKDIPIIVPELEGCFCCFHRVQELARRVVPDYCELVEPFLEAISDYLKSSFLMGTSTSYQVSMNTYRFNRIDDIGFIEWVEFGLIFERFMPKPEVRDHYLYRFILRLMSWVIAIVNDVLSLEKDFSRGQTGNYVRFLVTEEGLNIRDALKKTIKEADMITKDIKFACEQLVDAFDGDSNVKGLVERIKNIYNGSITFYKDSMKRYGQSACKIFERLN